MNKFLPGELSFPVTGTEAAGNTTSNPATYDGAVANKLVTLPAQATATGSATTYSSPVGIKDQWLPNLTYGQNGAGDGHSLHSDPIPPPFHIKVDLIGLPDTTLTDFIHH